MLGRLRAAPPEDDLYERCARVLDVRLNAVSTAPVAIALSGGGDSLALLNLAAAWTRAHGRPLLALTVDHGLNPASLEWTRAASAMADEAGANWRSLAWADDKPTTGLPAAARQARHRLLAEAARDAGARVILMAHTADDVAEGEVMRAVDAPGLGRLREWAPSPVWPQGRGVALLRPLLGVGRDQLRAWLRCHGLGWVDDPANADLSHPRIRARRALASAVASPHSEPDPASPLFAADGAGVVTASRIALISARPETARSQLAAALACAGGGDGPVRGRVVERLLDELRSGAAVKRNAGGALLRAWEDVVRLTAEPPRRGAGDVQDPAWVAPRLDLAIGRAAREADLASGAGA